MLQIHPRQATCRSTGGRCRLLCTVKSASAATIHRSTSVGLKSTTVPPVAKGSATHAHPPNPRCHGLVDTVVTHYRLTNCTVMEQLDYHLQLQVGILDGGTTPHRFEIH
uniref:Uncharacterized protein n=1 Tax=Lygus hesperus TaxID=30085 RepID=A0A146L3E0_LYGHE